MSVGGHGSSLPSKFDGGIWISLRLLTVIAGGLHPFVPSGPTQGAGHSRCKRAQYTAIKHSREVSKQIKENIAEEKKVRNAVEFYLM